MRLIAEPTPGPGPARNRGIALARAPIVAFLDSDCIADPGWLPAILEGFAADPACAVIGGDVRIFSASPESPNLAEAFDIVYGIRQELDDRPPRLRRHRQPRGAPPGVRGGRPLRRPLDRRGHGMGDARPGARLPDPLRAAGGGAAPGAPSMAELRRQWDRHVSHHWSMQPTTLRGRVTWVLRAGLMAISPLGEIPHILRSDRSRVRASASTPSAVLAAMRLYRARRMLAELVDPADRAAQRPLEPLLTVPRAERPASSPEPPPASL